MMLLKSPPSDHILENQLEQLFSLKEDWEKKSFTSSKYNFIAFLYVYLLK